MALTDRKRRKLLDHHFDLGFIARTQPQGNVKIHSSYIEMGNGYGSFVDIYHYPKNGMRAFWLAPIINQDNVVGIISICGQSSRAVRPQINRSLSELFTRVADSNLTPTEQVDADTDQRNLFSLYNSLRNHSEKLKRMYIRLFVYDKTLPQLRDRIDKIKNHFYNFGMTPFIDEQEYDYRSMFLPLKQQEQLENHRKGTIIQSYDLGGSYPFDFVSLEDPGGTYLGHTQTRGAFTFNPYNLRDPRRTRCFSLIAGNSGMGKSTLEKMLIDDADARGNFVRNFDITGEYRTMTEALNGINVDTSTKGLRVNMFEIFPTVTNAQGDIDPIGSFNQNISKIKTITHIMDSNLDTGDLDLLDDCLVKFYIQRKQWSYNPRNNPQKINILNLPHTQYPTLSEFMEYLARRKNQIENMVNPSAADIQSIQKLIYAYRNMESRFSDALDGHTNIPDFDTEKVVNFDLSGTVAASAGAENQLFEAIFFSYLSMVSSQVVRNGKIYRQAEKKLVKDSYGHLRHFFIDDKLGFDVNYYYINIDEAEQYFDVHYPDVVGMLAAMMEQMRKNKCAITLAFPTLKDILLSDEGNVSSDWESYHQNTSKIFGLIQYFHFFNLSKGDVAALKNFFKQNKAVTLQQLDTLPNLNKFEVLTVIVNARSYRWKTEITPAQQNRYR